MGAYPPTNHSSQSHAAVSLMLPYIKTEERNGGWERILLRTTLVSLMLPYIKTEERSGMVDGSVSSYEPL
ncbi:hypothetical protein J6590_061461 [Homalodisca vitripennis]|nr:hypothetical protein J6590_061461 [Homalodisca vitripennis]